MVKFLSFMISEREIKTNLEKIRAIIDMKSPKNLNEVQKLTGRIVTLNKFVLRSIDKCLPFFRILRKIHDWDDECEKVFIQLKEYLLNPLLLSQTREGETLYLYISVSPEVG